MKIVSLNVTVPMEPLGAVSAAASVPDSYRPGKGTVVVLAHGAGNDKEHPLLVDVSQGLAEAGFAAVRFNFPYKEQGRKAPDRQEVLALTWRRVCEFLLQYEPLRPLELVAAGKSMGGRVAAQMAAEGNLPAKKLVFLGYPLHAPGKKKPVRDVPLYQIRIPMLFVAGSRDPLCDLSILRTVLSRLSAPWELTVIEGGDHSFRLYRTSRSSQMEIHRRIVQSILKWLG